MQQYFNSGSFFSELCLQAAIHGFINAAILTEVSFIDNTYFVIHFYAVKLFIHLCEQVCHQRFLWQRNSPDRNAVVTRCHKKMQPCCTVRVQKGSQNLFPPNPRVPVTIQHCRKSKSFLQQTQRKSQLECHLISKHAPTSNSKFSIITVIHITTESRSSQL